MTNEEYVKIVCKVFDNDNGLFLLKHWEDGFSDRLHSLECQWSSLDTGVKAPDDRAIAGEMSKFNFIKGIQYIINNKEKSVGIDIQKLNEDLDNE